MPKHNTTDLYRLFKEAERLECELLCACYNAATRERHHRLFPICERAYKRKVRRRQACIAAAQRTDSQWPNRPTIRDSQDDNTNRFVTSPPSKPSSRSLWRVSAQDHKLHRAAH